MRSEMFSEETAWFCKIALSTTILSLREIFRRIKTTSTIYKFSRVQSSMIELFVFIVICGCTAMVYSKLILLLFSQ